MNSNDIENLNPAAPDTRSESTDEIFTSKEAAKFLKITTVFLYQLTSSKKLPVHRLGSKLLFLKSELLDFVKAN